jgi:hypothetical protein
MSGVSRSVVTVVQWALCLNLAVSTAVWARGPEASDPPPVPPMDASPSDVTTEQGTTWVPDLQRGYGPSQKQCGNAAQTLWADYCATRGMHGLGCAARLFCARPLLSPCNHCHDDTCLGCGRADCLPLPHILRLPASCTDCGASSECGCHRPLLALFTGRMLPLHRHAPVCATDLQKSGQANQPSPAEAKTNPDFVPIPPPLVDEAVSLPSPPEPENSSPPEPDQTPVRINPAPSGPPRNILPTTSETWSDDVESETQVSLDHLFD